MKRTMASSHGALALTINTCSIAGQREDLLENSESDGSDRMRSKKQVHHECSPVLDRASQGGLHTTALRVPWQNIRENRAMATEGKPSTPLDSGIRVMRRQRRRDELSERHATVHALRMPPRLREQSVNHRTLRSE